MPSPDPGVRFPTEEYKRRRPGRRGDGCTAGACRRSHPGPGPPARRGAGDGRPRGTPPLPCPGPDGPDAPDPGRRPRPLVDGVGDPVPGSRAHPLPPLLRFHQRLRAARAGQGPVGRRPAWGPAAADALGRQCSHARPPHRVRRPEPQCVAQHERPGTVVLQPVGPGIALLVLRRGLLRPSQPERDRGSLEPERPEPLGVRRGRALLVRCGPPLPGRDERPNLPAGHRGGPAGRPGGRLLGVRRERRRFRR